MEWGPPEGWKRAHIFRVWFHSSPVQSGPNSSTATTREPFPQAQYLARGEPVVSGDTRPQSVRTDMR